MAQIKWIKTSLRIIETDFICHKKKNRQKILATLKQKLC